MNYLDLFSGIGGFALGAYWAGWRFEHHYYGEVDEYAIKVYEKRFPEAINIGDIRTVSAGDLPPGRWIITGGFPCQDISVAGKGIGLQGSRSSLWFAMWRVIRDLQPEYVIIENVGALVRQGLETVVSTLAEIGFDAEWQDIRASDVGAPHRRERIWIVAYPSRNRRGEERSRQSTTSSQDVADSERARLQRRLQRQECTGELSAWACCRAHEDLWLARSGIRRVAYGVPSRVGRLKCLGNSIVPQIAEMLFRRLKEMTGV